MNSSLSTTENTNRKLTPSRDSQPVNFLTPRAALLETADGYLLEAEMPGVARDGVDLSVENGELTIVGRRSAAQPQGTQVYRESRGWDYRRVFQLDPSIDAGRITARMEQGVLRLHLPKAESMKPRRIEVTA